MLKLKQWLRQQLRKTNSRRNNQYLLQARKKVAIFGDWGGAKFNQHVKRMKKTEEVKLMIIDNFIEYYTTDEMKRDSMKDCARDYVREDHVDEIAQSFPQLEEKDEPMKFDNCPVCGSTNLWKISSDGNPGEEYTDLVQCHDCLQLYSVDRERNGNIVSIYRHQNE